VIEFHAFDHPQAQAEALAQAVGKTLGAALNRQAGATLAVSGGTSPRLFLQTLSGLPLDWAQIQVMLVDERWVPEDSDASNTRLVRENLLQRAAQSARFVPLADTALTLEQQIAALNAHAPLPDVAVLGMGEDGHTASLFADAPEWDDAISTAARFVAVHPVAAPHARVSLSFDALTRVDTVFLQISGSRKREVLDAAAAALQKNAISRLAHNERTTLHVYWCN
jgi:6-phosphogluconolactonase